MAENTLRSIQVEKTLYSNALITTAYGCHVQTATPVFVLSTPASTSTCLDGAREALQKLYQQSPALKGVPILMESGTDPQATAFLVLGGLGGAPLRERLLRLETIAEDEVLTIMAHHSRILAALHTSGYSGFQPTADEVWWCADPPALTLLGWEWVVANRDDALADLRAAAALWIELATGAPPGPQLYGQRGSHPWLTLSLDLCQLLLRLWRDQAPGEAQHLVAEISTLQALRHLSPEQLFQQGVDLLPIDPAQALLLLDQAHRTKSPPAGVAEAIVRAESALVCSVQQALEQGRHLLKLGQYQVAQRTLLRAMGGWHTQSDARLRAARWQTAANALNQAIDLGLTERGLPIRTELEPALAKAVDLADSGDVDGALKHIEALTARLPAGIELPALSEIQAELRVQTWWRQLLAYEDNGENLRPMVALYARFCAEQPNISYWPELAATLGDISHLERRLQDLQQRLTQADKLMTQARTFFYQANFAEAKHHAGYAAGLYPAHASQKVESLRLAQLATQCANAVAAGVAGEPSAMSAAERDHALQALALLRHAFPATPWVEAQTKRWQQALQAILRYGANEAVANQLAHFWPTGQTATPRVGAEINQVADSSTGVEQLQQERNRNQHLRKRLQRIHQLRVEGKWLLWYQQLLALEQGAPASFKAEIEVERTPGIAEWCANVFEQIEQLEKANESTPWRKSYELLLPLYRIGAINHADKQYQAIAIMYHEGEAEQLETENELQSLTQAVSHRRKALALMESPTVAAEQALITLLRRVALQEAQAIFERQGSAAALTLLQQKIADEHSLAQDFVLHEQLLWYALWTGQSDSAMAAMRVLALRPDLAEVAHRWQQLLQIVETIRTVSGGDRYVQGAQLMMQLSIPDSEQAGRLKQATAALCTDLLKGLHTTITNDERALTDDVIWQRLRIFDLILQLRPADLQAQGGVQKLANRLPPITQRLLRRIDEVERQQRDEDARLADNRQLSEKSELLLRIFSHIGQAVSPLAVKVSEKSQQLQQSIMEARDY